MLRFWAPSPEPYSSASWGRWGEREGTKPGRWVCRFQCPVLMTSSGASSAQPPANPHTKAAGMGNVVPPSSVWVLLVGFPAAGKVGKGEGGAILCMSDTILISLSPSPLAAPPDNCSDVRQFHNPQCGQSIPLGVALMGWDSPTALAYWHGSD